MTKKQILQKKEKAAAYFTRKLLQSKAGKDIARIILFGSVAKGEADEESDIDLMIFAKTPQGVEELVSDLSYDFLLEQGELIESHVYPTAEYDMPHSYFVKLATQTGRPIYEPK